MILTLTPNPALDVTYELPELRVGDTHRVSQIHRRAGGKGINVAGVLTDLGAAAQVLIAVGGSVGAELEADLTARGLDHRLVHSPVPARTSVAIVDPEHGATVLNEVGLPQPPQVWDDLVAHVHAVLETGGVDAVTVSGSFPPGAPVGWAAEVVSVCVAAACPVVLDICGPHLGEALSARPDLVKPNASEAAQSTGHDDPLRSAQALVAAGARRAVVSDGSRGLVAVSDDGTAHRARLSRSLSGNPTGAGDALTAALAAALVAAVPWTSALIRGVATAAAAVRQPVAGDVDPVDVTELIPDVILEEIPCP